MSGEARRRALAWVRGRIRREGGPDAVTKRRLAELAERAGIVVVRTDGGSGEVRKSDYLEALGYDFDR